MLNDLLSTICEAPDTQIDAAITKRIRQLIGQSPEIVATEMKVLLDESAHAALASDFAMMVMDTAWKMAAEQIVALPDADCENCEYINLNNPRSGGHCYMFRDKPGLKCGQFREHWNSKKHGTGPLTGDY